MKCVTVSFDAGRYIEFDPAITMERPNKEYFLPIGEQRVEFVRRRKPPYMRKNRIEEASVESYRVETHGKIPHRFFGLVGNMENPRDDRRLLLIRLPSSDESKGFFWEVFTGNPRVLVNMKKHLRNGHVGKGTRTFGDSLMILRPGDAIHLSHLNYTNGGMVVYFSKESEEECGIVMKPASEMSIAA